MRSNGQAFKAGTQEIFGVPSFAEFFSYFLDSCFPD
jgi:hypothetical protein